MKNNRIYLDYAATAPLRPEALDAMLPYFSSEYGNPSSVHEAGARAKEAVDRARRQVAELIGARASEILFTSGGTEADNWVLLGTWLQQRLSGKEGCHVVTGQTEHHAVLRTCRRLEELGARVSYVAPDRDGIVTVQAIREAIREDTVLISLMYANNEVGTLQPVEQVATLARERGILFHTDAVQAVGQVSVDVKAAGVDYLSASAHKLGGPKGMGFLYIRSGAPLPALLTGGGQERGRRAGTENVPGIVGLGAAASWAKESLAPRMERERDLRDLLISLVLEKIPGAHLNGHPTRRLPGNVSFCFDGIEGETLQTWMDLNGVCVSGGSACSSGSLEPSHVLLAMGISPKQARSALRMTLGPESTKEEIRQAADLLAEGVKSLRSARI